MNECERLGVHALVLGDTVLCCESPERVAGLLAYGAGELGEPDKRANAHPALTPHSTNPRAGLV